LTLVNHAYLTKESSSYSTSSFELWWYATYNRAAGRKVFQVPVVSVVAGVDTVRTVLTGVVTAVDVAVVSVDSEAVETGVVVCVVTLDTDSDVGGVVVAVVAVDTVVVVTVDSDSVVCVVGAVVLTATSIVIQSIHKYVARQLLLCRNRW